MPGRNGTGPNGTGPRTGRCFGRGRGYRGLRGGYPVAPVEMDPQQEKAMLEDQAKFLEDQLDQVKQQLKKFDENA